MMNLQVANKITIQVKYRKLLFNKNIILQEGKYYRPKHSNPTIKIELIVLNDNDILELMVSYRNEDLISNTEWLTLDEFLILFDIMPGKYKYIVSRNYVICTNSDKYATNTSIDFRINDYVTYTVINSKGNAIFYGNGQIQDMWNINSRVSACIIGEVEFHFTSSGLLMEKDSPIITKYSDERKIEIRKMMI